VLRRWHVPEIVVLAIPGMLLLALSVMQESFGEWRTEWGWAWSQWAAQVQLTGPMTGGLAAWLVHDARRAGRGEWLATTPRGGSLLRHRVLVSTVPAATAAAVTATALPFVTDAAGSMTWPLLRAVSAVAAVTGSAAVGGVVGRLLPKALAAPLVVVLLWGAVVGLLPLGTVWLRVGGAGHTLVGYEVVASLPFHRVITTVVVMSAAFLVLSARGPSHWSLGHRVATTVVGLAALGVLFGSGWFAGGTYDIRPDAAAAPDACSPSGPTVVCAMPGHAVAAVGAGPAMASILEARRALGIPTPDTVTELTPHELATADGRTGPGAKPLRFTIDPFSQSRNGDAAASLVVPPMCFAAQDGLTPEQFDVSDAAMRVLTLWAITVAREPAPAGLDDPAWARFVALPPPAQGEWLRGAITAAQACRFEDFRAIAS
jgi:hypothetical protein